MIVMPNPPGWFRLLFPLKIIFFHNLYLNTHRTTAQFYLKKKCAYLFISLSEVKQIMLFVKASLKIHRQKQHP